MFRDRHAPASWLVARTLALVIASTATFMVAIFLVVVWKAYSRKSTKNEKMQSSKRTLLRLLLANLVFSFLGAIVWGASLNAFSGLDVEFCNYWARLGGV
jgi:nitric oxide reductase large subunit